MFAPLRKKHQPLKNYAANCAVYNNQQDRFAPVLPCRVLITGATGLGKTNLLANLIYDHLKWDRIYLNIRDLNEPIYDTMNQVFLEVQKKEKTDFFSFNVDASNIPSVDEMNSKYKNIVIFDDLLMEADARNKIYEYFIRGRKKNCTVIYLSQSYYTTPKLIRLQCNYLIFFRPNDEREIRNIYQNHSQGLDKETFVRVFKEATSNPYNFLMLDLYTKDPNLKIRQNLDYGYIANKSI